MDKVVLDNRLEWVPKIQVITINDHIKCFYDGRYIEDYPDWVKANDDMHLGLSSYVIHKDYKAIIIDTMLYTEQAQWVKSYLQNMGIINYTVINSHWHPDHIAGNHLYTKIIGSNITKNFIEEKKEIIKSGALWHSWGDINHPGVPEVVSPNITFNDKYIFTLDDIKLELYNYHIHTVDHLVVYIPSEKILFAGDALEDNIIYICQGEEQFVPTFIENLKKLQDMDIDKIFPCHGSPQIIENGGYDKSIIKATIDYNTKLMERLQDKDYLNGSLESYLSDLPYIKIWEPYCKVHKSNLQVMYNHWKKKIVSLKLV